MIFVTINFSVLELEILKLIFEKCFKIEFLSGIDKMLALSYDKRKFLGYSNKKQEICNLVGTIIFE